MRTAILSDVHANLPALKAVLTDLISVGADRIVSLGDLVGYGPQPAEVLEAAYAHVDHFVLGNHDAVIAGRLDPSLFHVAAREMIEWTAARLDRRAAGFFAGQPYVVTGPSFRCSHGSPACPPRFAYVIEPEEARAAWDAAGEQILFVGHSHVPGIFVLGASGIPRQVPPQDFALEPGKRYLVNVGSVGQPRDGDVRACYCLFDEGPGEVRFRQVPFDLDAYRAAVAAAAPPLRTAYFLEAADHGRRQPLREVLGFRPPARESVEHEAVTVEHLGRAVRSARRWRAGAAALLVLALGAVAAACGLYRLARPEGIVLAAVDPRSRPPGAVSAGCLAAPDRTGPVTPRARLRDWTVRLSDPARQSVTVLDDTKGDAPVRVFRLVSGAPARLALDACPVRAAAGMRFQIQAACRAGPGWQGYAELCLVQRGRDGVEKPLLHCPLEALSGERWRFYRRSTAAGGLSQDAELFWSLRGEFAGELLVRDADLVRRK